MTITELLIGAVFLILLVWTAVASRFKQKTVSMAMRDIAWGWSTWAFVFGVLVGHWFLPILNPRHHAVGNVLPLILAVMLFDLYWRHKQGVRRVWFRYPGIWFALGVPAGALLWSQRLVM